MALEDTTNKQSFTAATGDTEFRFNVPFFDASTIDTANKKYGDIKVTREASGVITQFTPKETFTTPAVDGEFKLTATNNDPELGGTVTISVPATSGQKFVIERDVAYTQQYDLQEGSTINPTALNKAFDRVVAQNQQQNDTFKRTITFPITDPDSITYNVDSTPADRANKALGFDNDGNIAELSLSETNLIGVDNNAGLEFINPEKEVVTAYNNWNFTGNGVNLSFLLNDATLTDPYAYIVTIDGITQTPVTSYTINGLPSSSDNFITFASAPPLNTSISILNISVNLQLTGE